MKYFEREETFHTNLPLQFITNGFNNVFKVIVKKKRVMDGDLSDMNWSHAKIGLS